MDDRSANLLQHSDATADAFLTAGTSSDSLFVINLCAANVPQAIDAGSVQAWGIAGMERYRLYQVSRMEDGRRRYRVRLGFFTSEADAELVLQTVRGRFATAFSSCLADEDLKHASGYLKKPLHEIQEIQDLQRTGRYRLPKFAPEDIAQFEKKAPEARKAVAPNARISTPMSAPVTSIARNTAAKPTAKQPKEEHIQEESIVEFEWSPPRKAVVTSKLAPSPKQIQLAKIRAALNANVAPKPQPVPVKQPAPVKLTLAEKPSAPQSKRPSQSGTTGNYHVGAGRDIPDSGLSLANDSAAAQRQSAAPAQRTAAELPRPLVSAEALAKLRAAAQPRQQTAVIPTLDSTQTIRTLTKNEKEDENAPKWYVVQLAVSDQPANLDTMPRLDIFEAYRLYSIAAMDGTVIRHTLRLGFFSEQVSAEAVMGYLKTFFNEPRIERVSDAEQIRFARLPALKAPTETASLHAQVITLEEKRPTHPVEIARPAPAPETPVQTPKPAPVNRSASKYAAPAVKRSTQTGKKNTAKSNGRPGDKYAHLSPEERTAIREARLLGLSETAIRRVEGNSLLSRLVDKLTK